MPCSILRSSTLFDMSKEGLQRCDRLYPHFHTFLKGLATSTTMAMARAGVQAHDRLTSDNGWGLSLYLCERYQHQLSLEVSNFFLSSPNPFKG